MLNDEITMLTVASGVCRFSKVSEGSTRGPAAMAEPRQFFLKCYFILQSGFHCLKKRPFLSNFFQYLLWQRKLRKQKALRRLTKKHCPFLRSGARTGSPAHRAALGQALDSSGRSRYPNSTNLQAKHSHSLCGVNSTLSVS